jgi:hypothetical protein
MLKEKMKRESKREEEEEMLFKNLSSFLQKIKKM